MSSGQAPVRLCTVCRIRPVMPPSRNGFVYYYCAECDYRRKKERRDARWAHMTPEQREAELERRRTKARAYYQRKHPDATSYYDRETESAESAESTSEPISEPISDPAQALAVADSEQELQAAERPPMRASDAPGVLADVLLMVDRSRTAILNGEIDGLRVAVDVAGVRVHFGTARIGGSENGSNE